jgi:hypothetical protein
MFAPEHLKSLAPSSACTASAQRQTYVAEPRIQYEDLGQEREEDWRRSLYSLRMYLRTPDPESRTQNVVAGLSRQPQICGD